MTKEFVIKGCRLEVRMESNKAGLDDDFVISVFKGSELLFETFGDIEALGPSVYQIFKGATHGR